MTEKNKLFDNTICLAVTFHRPAKGRRVRTRDREVRAVGADDPDAKADQSKIRVGKDVIESEHYEAMGKIDRDFGAWAHRRALDSPLKRGTYLVPLEFVDEFYARLDADQARYNAEADVLAQKYDEIKERAKNSLKELYREDDFYSADRFRVACWVERKMFEFGPPGESKLNESVFEQEKKKWSDIFSEAEAEVKQVLRQSCRDLVAHLSDTLTPKADGKRKRIFASSVDKIVDFFDLFDKRNVLDDDELKMLVERGRRVLDGGESLVDALKENDDVRKIVKKQMDMVTTKLDALIQDGPRRMISFEED